MFVGQGDGGLVPTAGHLELFGPTTFSIVAPGSVHEFRARTVNQQGAQIGVAAFGDPTEALFATG